ncbi:hypothetical protein SKAU_G00190570 [Synaphobranchus kaupii]|uniref:HAT C-terminal dimerisation domain-containing protein n=1 Tax=Synaphobranchus kaupii TaxID=118154 RepID=A0A9Q1FDZ3_SYNKA|nr:hypothetical protein SKAU_G00190570 [Synaphobranchus kaupii]
MKMNVAYCIAKEELPFNKFKPLILLCKKNGADISPSYDNHVRCGEMIETIADEMKSDLAEEIGGSRYLSVMIDGDTDASNKECEMVYVRSDFENFLHLAEILFVMPISSAQCERGFSVQNRIKNTTRSSLHVSTAEDLIRISTEGCPLEQFNPSHVAAKWLSSSKRARRPNMKKWPADMLDL